MRMRPRTRALYIFLSVAPENGRYDDRRIKSDA
jgi:hypothetical protein